ncbi:MAG: DNA-protecting protein DprA, partial [Deltaproteobacteria bacterium]|nr:DNA-protecting protein DprA [Deltaproteobacteria bacterium]
MWSTPQSILNPKPLSVTSAPPNKLFCLGNAASLLGPCIAIVGTRRPTGYGLKVAFEIARDLARSGVCVVSGLARGIDGAAHVGALAGGGQTVAVLGHGLDRIYPKEHQRLALRILEMGGALLSEFEVGVAPLPAHFPQRNRIIAGLSLGVVVVEAAERSGSLITAGFAADEGREVFVVPSRAGDTSFAGSHRLIQDGAKLVNRAADILVEFGVKVEEPLPSFSEMEPLERFFWSHGGVASLSHLHNAPRLKERFREALSTGEVREYALQKFVWI